MNYCTDYITARRQQLKAAYSDVTTIPIEKVLPSLMREVDKVLVFAMYMVSLHKVTKYKAQDMCKFYNGFVHRPDEYYNQCITQF